MGEEDSASDPPLGSTPPETGPRGPRDREKVPEAFMSKAIHGQLDESDIVDHFEVLRIGEFIDAGLHVIPDDPSHTDELPPG